jgi:hypothetical protein
VPVYSFTLTDRTGGDIFSHVLSDTGPSEPSSNKIQRLVASPVASRGAIVVGLEYLASDGFLCRHKDTINVLQQVVLGDSVVLQQGLRYQS